MPAPRKYSDETVEKARQLIQKGYTEKQAAEAVGVSRGMLRQRFEVCPTTQKNLEEVKTLMLVNASTDFIADKTGLGRRTVEIVKSWVHRNQSVEMGTGTALIPAPDDVRTMIMRRKAIGANFKPGRYVVLGDTHLRFHDPRVIEEILTLKGDYDGIILAGDIIDEFWLSRFRKSAYVSFADELTALHTLIHAFSRKFNKVLMLMGNHESRRWKALCEAGQFMAAQAGTDRGAKKVFKTAEDLMDMVYDATDPNVYVIRSCWTEICNGKILIGHPDNYTVTPGVTAFNVFQHFVNHKKDYDIAHDVSAFLCAHTHGLTGPFSRLGVYLWELPCGCGMLPYQTEGKLGKGRVDTGYSILTTRPDGSFRFNESRSFLVDGW